MKLEARIRKYLRPIKKLFHKNNDFFLKEVSGVIHVGANCGQEAPLYARHNLKVVWFEPLPEVFRQLERNIQNYKTQVAFNCLITDEDGKKFRFHVANNNGESSSIFEMSQHKEVWPEIDFQGSIECESKTVPAVLLQNGIAPDEFQALIMDVQGAELLVLKGCEPLLGLLKYIRTEAADFESYEGGCQLPELQKILVLPWFQGGFPEHHRAQAWRGILL